MTPLTTTGSTVFSLFSWLLTMDYATLMASLTTTGARSKPS
jgi:hypothetical protein